MLKKIMLFLVISIAAIASETSTEIIKAKEIFEFYKAREGTSKWGVIKNNGNKYVYAEKERKIKVGTDGLNVTDKSDIETKEVVYDNGFFLIKKEMRNISSGGEFDRLSYGVVKDKIIMEKYKKGKLVEKKEKEKKNIFEADAESFEYLYSKGCTVFNGDMLTPEGKYNMEYKLSDNGDIEKMGSLYAFPDEFRKNVDMKKKYRVYVGGMTGIVANFYPHKWYYIINSETGKMIASFGGNPKDEAEFEYRIN